jgi:tetratricopeptide (TPR) repeat protein
LLSSSLVILFSSGSGLDVFQIPPHRQAVAVGCYSQHLITMRLHLTLLSFAFATLSFAQLTSWEAIYDVPQGKKGIRQFTKLIEKDSNNAELYWRRGYEYYRTKQYYLAVPDFNKAILKDSTFNHAAVLSDRGLAKEMLGNYKDAVDDFSKAIAYSYTQDTTIPQGLDKYYYHRGRTMFKLGDTANAILNLDSSLIFWNNHFYARKLRAALYAMTEQYQKAMIDYDYLQFKWQGGGSDFSINKEYAMDFYWRAITKQKLGNSTYLKDMDIAVKLKYKKFKVTDLRGL